MIPRCPRCGGVDRGHAISAALTIEQVRHYLRELEMLGVPPGALELIREWGSTLGRCTCEETILL